MLLSCMWFPATQVSYSYRFCYFQNVYLALPHSHLTTPGALVLFIQPQSLLTLSLHLWSKKKVNREKKVAVEDADITQNIFFSSWQTLSIKKELQRFSGWDEPLSDLLCMEMYCTQSVNKSDKLTQLGKLASISTDNIL